jgi:hypothetical protein
MKRIFEFLELLFFFSLIISVSVDVQAGRMGGGSSFGSKPSYSKPVVSAPKAPTPSAKAPVVSNGSGTATTRPTPLFAAAPARMKQEDVDTSRKNFYTTNNYTNYNASSGSSFGLWHGVFLYYLLSGNNHADASTKAEPTVSTETILFFYNHWEDPDIQEFLAKGTEDPALKSRTEQIIAGVKKLEGMERNKEYLPPGVPKEVALNDETIGKNDANAETSACFIGVLLGQ